MNCACGCDGVPSPGRNYVHGHNATKPRPVEKLANGCWLWTGGKGGGTLPYGRMKSGGRMRPAHHVFYEEINGPVPEGLQLDHLCRNTLCVNPDHLEAVTGTENVRRSSSAKLTAHDVALIRVHAGIELETARLNGLSRRRRGWQDEMAERFGVTRDNIKQIVRGTSWR